VKNQICRVTALAVLIGLVLTLLVVGTRADGPFDALTPNEYTFIGRRGATYTATWDTDTYEIRIDTPDGTFPWDWMSFVSPHGAISLGGLSDVGETFTFSDPASISGAEPGDVIRIKGRDIHNLAHLTKLGLIIGTGPSAERRWFSEGTISTYVLAPDYVGYEAQVLGRAVTVRLFHLAPAEFHPVGVFEVTIDDPANARLILATDLEPALGYRYAVEFRSSADTVLDFDASQQAIVGEGARNTSDEYFYDQPVLAYVYSDSPLHSTSTAIVRCTLGARTIFRSIAISTLKRLTAKLLPGAMMVVWPFLSWPSLCSASTWGASSLMLPCAPIPVAR